MNLLKLKTHIVTASMLTASFFLPSTSSFADTSVWKITKGSDHIYIGGTVHILPPSEFPLPEEFTQAYQSSDAIVLETPLPEPGDASFQAKLMQQVAYQDNQKLSDKLSSKTFKDLETYLAAFGINVNDLNSFKPGFIVMMVAMLEAKRAELAGEGVDAYFDKLASKDNKPKEYLESGEFQINLIANMGAGNEEQLISSTLAQMDEFKKVFTQILPAWRTGKEQQLAALVINQIQEEDPATFKQMFTDRNKNWLPLIEQMFTDQDRELVLVGVGHLVGEHNVLQLLSQAGYKVTKL